MNGFTFLELALVICVVSILYAVALRYSIRVLAMTERVTVEQTILALQNAVEFQALRHLLSGNMERLVQLEQSNPMDYLVRKPNAYLGELKNVDPKQVKEGAWYFDKTNRLIVYRLRYGRYFESTLKGPPLIRLSIKLQYTDVNRNGRFDEKSERVTGLTLEPKESYAFTVEPSSLAGFLK
ncbi:MAG: hypothetical protein HY559_04275 [Gammaproteobacteria bacterium]|nr:hypothetical protein [Gammaproteobacteria bacterium]